MAYVNVMEWVGAAHNACVHHVLDTLGPRGLAKAAPGTLDALVNEYLRSAGIEEPGKRPSISRAATAALDELLALFTKPTTLSALTKKVTTLERRTARVLRGHDLRQFQAAASVARYSAQLWAAAAEGGDNAAGTARINRSQVAAADVRGFAEGGMFGASRASLGETDRQLHRLASI